MGDSLCAISCSFAKPDLIFLSEKFLEELFRLPKSLFVQDYGLGMSFGVADEPLFMKPVHRFPVKSFPGPRDAMVGVCVEMKQR